MLLRSRRLTTSVVLGVAVATFAALAASVARVPRAARQPQRRQHLGHQQRARHHRPVRQADRAARRAARPGQARPPDVNVWQDGPVVTAYDATGGRIYAVNAYDTAFYDARRGHLARTGRYRARRQTLAVLSTDHSPARDAAQRAAAAACPRSRPGQAARDAPAAPTPPSPSAPTTRSGWPAADSCAATRSRRHADSRRGCRCPRPTRCRSPRSATSPSSPT